MMASYPSFLTERREPTASYSYSRLGQAKRRPNTHRIGLLGLPPAFAGVDPTYGGSASGMTGAA
jgi:hypothetical protein